MASVVIPSRVLYCSTFDSTPDSSAVNASNRFSMNWRVLWLTSFLSLRLRSLYTSTILCNMSFAFCGVALLMLGSSILDSFLDTVMLMVLMISLAARSVP